MLNDIDVETIQLIRLTGLREQELTSAKSMGGDIWNRVSQSINDHNALIAMGEKHSRQKAVQDPVHGAILLEPWELDVISTWEMLRLRYVMQLGPAHIVYRSL